jgi:hypothetical protein
VIPYPINIIFLFCLVLGLLAVFLYWVLSGNEKGK